MSGCGKSQVVNLSVLEESAICKGMSWLTTDCAGSRCADLLSKARAWAATLI